MFLCIVDLLLLLAVTKQRSTVPSKKSEIFFQAFLHFAHQFIIDRA